MAGPGQTGEIPPDLAAAAEHDHLGPGGVERDEPVHPWGHLPAIFDDVTDKVPADAVIDADSAVLTAAMA
jgi:hypothetical protein